MSKNAIVFLTILCTFTAITFADDLFLVKLDNPDQAKMLDNSLASPVAVVSAGYLVLMDHSTAIDLNQNGLIMQMLEQNITLDELAIDQRHDQKNVGQFQIVFEEDNFRLYRVSQDLGEAEFQDLSLLPVKSDQLEIKYYQPQSIDVGDLSGQTGIDLFDLIDLINQDSLISYTERLQAYLERVVGTDSNYASRLWIYDKLVEFGYENVTLDNFQEYIDGEWTDCANVVAYKIGTLRPDQYIVVGAHYDGVPTSPAANDNGSGTAGVMEIARVLQDIETQVTFVFILFDAEEEGLYGSYHYADEAAARGDDIIYMLNMDMIGHYENDNTTRLYHGPILTYTELWRHLADSLLGHIGELRGNSAGSDHYPFIQNGYEASFVFEYIFSNVYHSYHDSTTYMNFDYMLKNVQISLATVYTVDQIIIPEPRVIFDYSENLPMVMLEGTPETFYVGVSGLDGASPVPGTGMLHYSINNGSYTSTPMTEISSHYYQATLPAQPGGVSIRYYFSVEDALLGTATDPSPADPYITFSMAYDGLIIADDFETDQGWTASGTATAGYWERGIPAGGGDRGDPPSDYDGSGQCYLTENNDDDSDVDNGKVWLTSPIFDLSEGYALLNFALWYTNHIGGDPYKDIFSIYASNNGGSSWQHIKSIGPAEGSIEEWQTCSLWINRAIIASDNMRIRFEASDLSNESVVEAAIDALSILKYTYPPVQITNESIPDWTIGIPYAVQMETDGGIGDLNWYEPTANLPAFGMEMSIDGLIMGTPSATGIVSISAKVIDEMFRMDDKNFQFTINDAVEITTNSLSPWTIGISYQQQLNFNGGTAPLEWSDFDNDLNATGLSLSTEGLLSGIPIISGPITFTASLTDMTGSNDQNIYQLIINPAVSIVTDVLPACSIGVAYSYQITAGGGTGEITFSDENSILAGTGLELSPEGTLFGTASDPALLELTIGASDQIGSFAMQTYQLNIVARYVCGDANDDEFVNIGDAVYLNTYIFHDGPAPIPLEAGDTNCDQTINIGDAVYLINHIFHNGPEPGSQCK